MYARWNLLLRKQLDNPVEPAKWEDWEQEDGEQEEELFKQNDARVQNALTKVAVDAEDLPDAPEPAPAADTK